MKEIKLGTLPVLDGLHISFMPSAVTSFLGFWALAWAASAIWLGQPIIDALLLGLSATLLHWLSEFLHQVGHALAARFSGHGMSGIRFWGVLSTSVYPADEPALPGKIHIQRALGGPAMNAILTAILGLLLFILPPGPIWMLAGFAFMENLFVFTLQALLPLGFNDGETIRRWWGR